MRSSMIESLLKELALHGAINRYILVTTSQIGASLGISQQSASRWISKTAEMGLIRKESVGRNIKVKITREGLNILKYEFFRYLILFGSPAIITLKGIVISGLGEGKYYVMKGGYRTQIHQKLFFDPYPGTLNVKLYPEYIEKFGEILEHEPVILDGFSEGDRNYGRVFSYFATLNGTPGALIVPEMTQYRDTVEIISEYSLREKHRLKDGTNVEIKVYL